MADVLTAARGLVDDLAAGAEAADRGGCLPDTQVRQLRDIGVFRLLQPRAFGGIEASPLVFSEVVRTLAAACASTGWIASVMGVHPWQLALFPPSAQEEVWGDDPDTLLSSSYAPVGRLQPVDEGFVLTGHWRFSSGVTYASWVLLGAMTIGADGVPTDYVTVLVPRDDVRVDQVWDSVGLRATASDDVHVDDAFVPHHRVLRFYDQTQLRGPGQVRNDGPLYRLPFGAIFTHAITAPLLGAAAGGHRAYVAAMRSRVRLSLGGGTFVEDPHAQVAVARAAAEVDAGVLQTERDLRELLAHAEAGRQPPMELRLRTRRDQVRAAERAVEAVDLLFRTAGGTSLRRGTPIERVWRDVHAGSMHVANEASRVLALYGRGAFGLDVEEHLL